MCLAQMLRHFANARHLGQQQPVLDKKQIALYQLHINNACYAC